MTGERGEIIVADGVAVDFESTPGSTPPVVMVPSLGRGLEDFESLTAALTAEGHATIAVNPRGVGASRGPVNDVTLFDFAADVAALLDARDVSSAHLVGHAWGNRVVRCVAVRRRDLVQSLSLLAAGGLVQPGPDSAVLRAMLTIFDRGVTGDERVAALGQFFFAPMNDPELWRDGWWLDAAALEAVAVTLTRTEEWWEPPAGIPLLVVQGLDDLAAPPENGRRLVANRPGARLVELPDAGHALLPEQPAAIADAVVRHVNEH